MVDRNAGIPEDKQIVFRIGIHLGDVIEESDGDLMGDGVNIAARLEGVAKPGAICLSEDAYRQVKARLDLAVTDLGETKLKNIAEPVRAYALQVGAAAAPSRACAEAARLALPDKPSIAVLPFQNMSGDPEQEYFADGMVEDIITGAVAHQMAVRHRAQFELHVQGQGGRHQAGRARTRRALCAGGQRPQGRNRLRITAQLIDAETGAHLWADRFDGALDDVFDLQDQITERVVGVIEPNVLKSEIERARRKPPESLDAYDLYLRALPHMTSPDFADARAAASLL